LLGLPIRLALALAASAVPLLAVGLFSITHDWPPPPACGPFAIFGCPTAPFPIGVQALDWLYLVGPLLGLTSVVIRRRREPVEGGLLAVLMVRYLLPAVGLLVSLGCGVQLWSWLTYTAI
jgi:hypothetical protein